MEAQAEYKSEYEGGKILNMSGATIIHNLICANLYGIGYQKLRNTQCQMLPSELKIEVSDSKFYYPDAKIVCNSPNLVRDRDDIIDNSQVIFEVLSASTRARDRHEKMKAYLQLPSLKEYVLIDQYKPCAEVYSFQEPGKWLYHIYEDREALVRFSRIQVELQLKDIYNKVVFDVSGLPN